MGKRLHPKSYAKLRKAFDENTLAREIEQLLLDETPANAEDVDRSPYEWPCSEALIVARWLQRRTDD